MNNDNTHLSATFTKFKFGIHGKKEIPEFYNNKASENATPKTIEWYKLGLRSEAPEITSLRRLRHSRKLHYSKPEPLYEREFDANPYQDPDSFKANRVIQPKSRYTMNKSTDKVNGKPAPDPTPINPMNKSAPKMRFSSSVLYYRGGHHQNAKKTDSRNKIIVGGAIKAVTEDLPNR